MHSCPSKISMYNRISFAGIFLLIGFGWLLSTNRRVFNWRVVLWGVGLQTVFASLFSEFRQGQVFPPD